MYREQNQRLYHCNKNEKSQTIWDHLFGLRVRVAERSYQRFGTNDVDVSPPSVLGQDGMSGDGGYKIRCLDSSGAHRRENQRYESRLW